MEPTYYARKNAIRQRCTTLEDACQQLITWSEDTAKQWGYDVEPKYGPEYGPQGWGYRVTQWGSFAGRMWVEVA